MASFFQCVVFNGLRSKSAAIIFHTVLLSAFRGYCISFHFDIVTASAIRCYSLNEQYLYKDEVGTLIPIQTKTSPSFLYITII
ncbi:hypothetical protein BD408DRAFT_424622 [Parasitella parasitica]|nr:hypothetical protein BD408DRAFT_424622 [Parasitella parasitica]